MVKDTILIIEDDESIIERASYILKSQGHPIQVARSIDEAVELTKNNYIYSAIIIGDVEFLNNQRRKAVFEYEQNVETMVLKEKYGPHAFFTEDEIRRWPKDEWEKIQLSADDLPEDKQEEASGLVYSAIVNEEYEKMPEKPSYNGINFLDLLRGEPVEDIMMMMIKYFPEETPDLMSQALQSWRMEHYFVPVYIMTEHQAKYNSVKGHYKGIKGFLPIGDGKQLENAIMDHF